jgi:hypothetical protein
MNPPRHPPQLHVHIEALVVHGLEVARPERLVLALERALAEGLATQGLPENWGEGRAMLSLGPIELRSAEPDALAEAVSGALLGPGQGGGR